MRHADVAARHDDAHLLRHIARLALAADARRVDEDILRALVHHGLVDGIARGSGDGRNDGPLFTGERVERSEEHTSELQSLRHLVCRLLLEKKTQTLKYK